MNNREEISVELQSISATVATIPFVNVFTVEEAYFSSLNDIIMAQIAIEKASSAHTNLSVPEGYFESLPSKILHKIHALENEVNAELNEISPLIAGIESKETFTAPKGYFENLEFVPSNEETAKVISINKPRSFFKYAAAAVITGLLGLSIVSIVDRKDSSDPKVSTAGIKTVTTPANTALLNGSFDEALNNISDNEIEQYLQKSGQDVNAALVASSTDEIEKLPEATDYLLDENVLENYLKENNLNN